MLVLTRRVGEEIVIAGNIRVMVVGVKGRMARLGITAPSTVPVVRLELLAECSESVRSPECKDEKPVLDEPSQSSQ